MSAPRAFVDTNVLAYALDASDPTKQARAQHILTSHSGQLVVSTQVLLELYTVCERKLAMSPHDSAVAVRAVARLDVVPADRSLMLDAVALAADREVSVFDAAILCAALRAECTQLLTEDSTLAAVVSGIEAVNSFS